MAFDGFIRVRRYLCHGCKRTVYAARICLALLRYTQLRDQIMDLKEGFKRTAQLAITEACRQGSIVQADGQYRLPL